MRSLRYRAIRGAVLWAVASIVIGLVALLLISNSLASRHFNEDLSELHNLLIVALDESGGDADALADIISQPQYSTVLSGQYWQVTGEEGQLVGSRSLFDVELIAPLSEGSVAEFWEATGPLGDLRGLHQLVTLENGSVWHLNVAQSLEARDAERREIQQDLFTALAVIGILGILGALVQLAIVLRPLTKLREEVTGRWSGDGDLDPTHYPTEVAPLVSDINTLLKRNREVIEGTRRQTADLAHALKTPASILRNEIESREEKGEKLDSAKEALSRIDAQISRSLARIRAGNASTASYQTDVRNSVERLARLFRAMPSAADLVLEIDIADGLIAPMDRQDIEEVLGNLLENALKWRQQVVRVSAEAEDGQIFVHVDDDGPGIPPEKRQDALRVGGRLDTSAPGSGLGLAIAADLMAAYEGQIKLDDAPDLGGLRVTLTIARARKPSASLSA